MKKFYFKTEYLSHEMVAEKIFGYVDTVPMADLLSLMEKKPRWKYIYSRWQMEPSWVRYVFLPLLLLFPLFWVSLPFLYVLNGYWGVKNIRARNFMEACGWPYNGFCYDGHIEISKSNFSRSLLGWQSGLVSGYSKDLDDILRGIEIREELEIKTSLRFRLTIFPFFFVLVILFLFFPFNYILTGRRTWDLDWVAKGIQKHNL